jgi:site-specific DNA-methyltransferase (adenine-specific)
MLRCDAYTGVVTNASSNDETHFGQAHGLVYFGDNLAFLKKTADASVDLVYIDPPFNTGKTQRKTRTKTTPREDGDRIGFGGRRYATEFGASTEYSDVFDDYMGFLEPRLREAYRVLKSSGSFYLHLDYRQVHYCKVLMDQIFGRECFQNEIIWAYDYGGRPKNRWPAKHDNILYYVKDPAHFTFNKEAIDRIPYMAPGLVGPEKAARGKLPTDTWWQTIVPPGGRESTGYATQKPIAILRRIITASSTPGDVVLDFFAGSGTTGAAAAELGRRFVLADENPQAIEVMHARFADLEDVGFVESSANPGDIGVADS